MCEFMVKLFNNNGIKGNFKEIQMKIVNAVWEKRNIGCETVEVTFDRDDSLEAAEKTAAEPDTEYAVLKMSP